MMPPVRSTVDIWSKSIRHGSGRGRGRPGLGIEVTEAGTAAVTGAAIVVATGTVIVVATGTTRDYDRSRDRDRGHDRYQRDRGRDPAVAAKPEPEPVQAPQTPLGQAAAPVQVWDQRQVEATEALPPAEPMQQEEPPTAHESPVAPEQVPSSQPSQAVASLDRFANVAERWLEDDDNRVLFKAAVHKAVHRTANIYVKANALLNVQVDCDS
ncbi:uncharacterized protein AMSG_02850 [Thecamonas trahens ATCC 50062]|uniref:Uncharacterized protein n=1 Tax=Thecamonas trahens ATCC 50062 TaxID=461836 RepID=A0A0L0D2H9_THETB|nr:hypothetical protein AMSG_02850 [Thecamonas trahens ATCC 50062]KNC46396.1 hypothetical protein AMSG_02850 [Thecamonas trahens ATCC 50062]|eukprot:XP_013760689.1 hypothetical protein AMSG_02850 [Thecamonas trahens ATCC 50062]